MPWSKEREDRVRELWQQGYSASQISVDLGDKSRSAVLGKINRLGLTKQDKPQPSTNSAPRTVPQRRTRARATPPQRSLAREVVKKEETPIPIELPSLELRLHELDDTRCKWPTNGVGKDITFCGQLAEGTKPYCPVHTQRGINVRAFARKK